MRITIAISALAFHLATPAFAQSVGPVSSTTTITRDPDAGTFSRDTSVTRSRDGAVATSSTGFAGRTASRDYERTRTTSGYTESGSITRPNGRSYGLNGSRVRSDNGFTRDRALTNADGATVASRNVAVARADGQVTRTATRTGPRSGGQHGGRGRRC